MNRVEQLRKEKDDLATLRREAGVWLREKREEAGLSQRALAKKIGLDYYTFISQLESGRGRVPPERYEIYAVALGVPVREFAMTLMRLNDPIVYRLVFPESVMKPDVLADLVNRLRSFEANAAISWTGKM